MRRAEAHELADLYRQPAGPGRKPAGPGLPPRTLDDAPWAAPPGLDMAPPGSAQRSTQPPVAEASADVAGRVLEARVLRYPTAVRDDYVLQHHLWSDLRTLALLRTDGVRAVLGPSVLPGADAAAPSQAGSGVEARAEAREEPVVVERALPLAGHLWVRSEEHTLNSSHRT